MEGSLPKTTLKICCSLSKMKKLNCLGRKLSTVGHTLTSKHDRSREAWWREHHDLDLLHSFGPGPLTFIEEKIQFSSIQIYLYS